jgi:hypothetical protein
VFDSGRTVSGCSWLSCFKSKLFFSLFEYLLIVMFFRFPNTRCHPDPVKLYLVKKVEYVEQMKLLYPAVTTPQDASIEISSSVGQGDSSIDPLQSSASEFALPLRSSSPFSFSPCLHRMLGRSRYIHTGDEGLKGEEVKGKIGNNRSDSLVNPSEKTNNVTPGEANTGVTDGGDIHERDLDDDDKNQALSSLEYSDGEGGNVNKMVTSETENEEEVDELNSSEYEGLSMGGMLVNTDTGGYYEEVAENMDVTDDTAQLDMGNGIPEADVDEDLLEMETGNLRGEMMEDENPVEMEVDGETCLFSREAIAELHLLWENARLRGEEMDEEPDEFSEEREYGDLISTVVVQAAPVAGPSQPRRGRTGGNSEY